MLYVSILVACVILGFAFSKGWIHALKYRNLPPGSFGVPFIGETIQFADPHQFMQERIKKYGLVFKSHLLGKPSIIVCGKENVDWLIRQDNESLTQQYALPGAMTTMLGEHNSANLPEEEWRWMRKHSAFATLSRETLMKSVPVIENLLHCHIREWEKLGNLKEWYTLLENFSFDVGSYFLWGDPSYGTERKKTIHHDFEMMGEAMMTAPINLPGTTWYKGLQARKRMVSSASKIISEISQTGEYDDKGIVGAWLSNLSDEEKLDEKVTDMFIGFLFAAHHTTTSALAFTVISLAQNPEVLQKVREEIAEILPENEPLTFENLSKLRYLHMVQQEVLRLHSPANLIYRILTKDVEYQGHVFPKGWLIIPNFISIHRDSNAFEEELKFDPERWNTGKPLYAFGAGIHQCLGRNIALLEGKMLVVLLARNYDWELPPQDLSYQQLAGGSKPKSGLHAILKRRVK